MPARVPQPSINRALREVEQHEFWPGFIVAIIGGLLAFGGVRHLTGVDTVEGSTAWETQLIKAFSSGGLQYADRLAAAEPPRLDDPAAAAEALDRWSKQRATASASTWKVRVDTGAKTPCPT